MHFEQHYDKAENVLEMSLFSGTLAKNADVIKYSVAPGLQNASD